MATLDRSTWLVVVIGASVLAFLPVIEDQTVGASCAVLALLCLALGCRVGPKPVLAAALAVLLTVGVVNIAIHGDRRDAALPECPSLMDGGSQRDVPCEETVSGQAASGAGPAALILLFGMTTGLMRFAWDQGSKIGETPSGSESDQRP